LIQRFIHRTLAQGDSVSTNLDGRLGVSSGIFGSFRLATHLDKRGVQNEVLVEHDSSGNDRGTHKNPVKPQLKLAISTIAAFLLGSLSFLALGRALDQERTIRVIGHLILFLVTAAAWVVALVQETWIDNSR